MKRNPRERLNYECVVAAVKRSSESVMVWGVWGGVKRAGYLIQDINKKEQSIFHIIRKIIFQHDNNPKHFSKLPPSKRIWNTILEILTWPSQSPDPSYFQLIGDYLDRRV